MPEAAARPIPARVTLGIFALVLGLHLLAATTGWRYGMMPGNTFRQSQTALTTFFIQRDANFSLAYPTPVLGKPWSIPMEFPLYQWTVVGLNRLLGGPLVESARLLSLSCFYLLLPAVWLLLRVAGLDPARRWLVLAFVPVIPVFIFYSRAFLIESMALLFSVWFLAAISLGLTRAHRGWLTLAAVCGTVAALVKVTTVALFIAPVVLVVTWQWVRRRDPGSRQRVVRTALTLVAPIAAALAWIAYTDRIKGLNPAADMLQSGPQRIYNFGHLADRISGDYWTRWLHMSAHAVIHPAVFAGLVVVAIVGPRRWRPWMAGGVALFCLAPAVFPFLYAWHDYYYYANALFLALALGAAALALLDSRLPRWAAGGLIATALILQAKLYCTEYLPEQRVKSNGDSGLTQFLFDLTDPNDVLVVAGQDWNSMLPWSTQRRALMIRHGFEFNPPYLEKAFNDLKGETVAALILTGETRTNQALLALAQAKFDLHPEPFAEFLDSVVYVNRSLRDEWSARAPFSYDRVRVLHRNEAVPPLVRRDLKDLHAKADFGGFSPRPVRFEVPYGLSTYWPTPRFVLNTHATTHLWFQPPPGRHRVRLAFGILDAAWQRPDKTDGVEFAFALVIPGASPRRVWSRLLDPAHAAADRGEQEATFEFELPPGAELQLSTLPGPAGINAYDWAYVARCVIE